MKNLKIHPPSNFYAVADVKPSLTRASLRNTSKNMAATPSESAQIASTSIPKTETSVLGTIYGYLVSDWGGRRRIQRSVPLTSSSSAQTSGEETKWKDALDQERESIH